MSAGRSGEFYAFEKTLENISFLLHSHPECHPGAEWRLLILPHSYKRKARVLRRD